jgi:hypothetical protein
VFSVFLAAGVLAGCGGEEAGTARCEGLVVELALDEGWFGIDGTADGRPFGCSFYFEYDGWGDRLENVYFGGTCTGPARFAGDRLLAFDGKPATIVWTGGPTGPDSTTTWVPHAGRLEPEYRAFGACPDAEIDLRSR